MRKGAVAAARRRDGIARSPATVVMKASRRRDGTARSQATGAWTPAPIMLRKMKSILSHRRRLDIAKPATWGLRSLRGMPVSLLPFHIVTSILSWLPVKSLLKFRCVCKAWRSLTDNPSFIKEHHDCSRALGRLALISTIYLSPEVLLYDYGDNGEVRNQAFNMRFGDGNGYVMSNPVNGLICWEFRSPGRYDEGNYYLLNPATRELVKLPRSGNGPWDTVNSLGLGVDSSTGGYKLVKLFNIRGSFACCGCKVLELGTQEWREVGGAPCMIPVTLPVHLNGALHWISRRGPTGNITSAEMTIVAFNLKDENFRSITVPPECRTLIGGLVYLGEWEGFLCIVKVTYRCVPVAGSASMTDLRIWRMEDYATCRWREAHCSHLPNHASIDGQLSLVGVRGHEMLLVQTWRGVPGSIFSHDLRTGILREIYNDCPGRLQFLTESLISPRCLAGNPSLH